MQEKNSNNTARYNFEILLLLKEAFARSYGAKWSFIGAFLIYGIITIITDGILEVIFPKDETAFNEIIASFLSVPVTLPITVGITMLGIKQARDESLEISSVLNYFSMVLPLLLVYVAMNVLILLGLLLFILPGIYLSIAYFFSYALVVDKGLGVWEAMELSRKTVTEQWFKFFGLALLSILLIIISAIPLGIGLIWSIPTIYIAYGLLYHHLFDDEDEERENL